MTMMRRAFQLSRMVARAAAPAMRSPLPALSQPSISRASIFQVPRNFSTGTDLKERYIQVPRNFSTGTDLKERYIQVPVPMYGVTGNYASALYIAAVKAGKLLVVQSEMESIMKAYKTSPSFQNFVKDLSIPSKIRVKAVKETFAEAGFSDITKNFLAVVAEHGRLKVLEGIVKKFTSLTKARSGDTDFIVTTAIPLPEKEEKELKQTLVKRICLGKSPPSEKEERLLQLCAKRYGTGKSWSLLPQALPEKEEQELEQLFSEMFGLKGDALQKNSVHELRPELVNKLYTWKTVHLQQKIDRNILGGMVVEFEGKLIDMSIKTMLKKMEDTILNTPVELLGI